MTPRPVWLGLEPAVNYSLADWEGKVAATMSGADIEEGGVFTASTPRVIDDRAALFYIVKRREPPRRMTVHDRPKMASLGPMQGALCNIHDGRGGGMTAPPPPL
jgi:hypothetical protein